MEVPRLGVKSELQLPAYTTATARWDPSCICNLHWSSQQHWTPDPLSMARDRTHILMDTGWIRFHRATMGTPSVFLRIAEDKDFRNDRKGRKKDCSFSSPKIQARSKKGKFPTPPMGKVQDLLVALNLSIQGLCWRQHCPEHRLLPWLRTGLELAHTHCPWSRREDSQQGSSSVLPTPLYSDLEGAYRAHPLTLVLPAPPHWRATAQPPSNHTFTHRARLANWLEMEDAAQNSEEVLAVVKLPFKGAWEPNEFPSFPNKGPSPSPWIMIASGFSYLVVRLPTQEWVVTKPGNTNPPLGKISGNSLPLEKLTQQFTG